MGRTPILLLLSYLEFLANAYITSPPLIRRQPAESNEILIPKATNSSDVFIPIYFYCEADGEPRPSFRWTKNDEPFTWELYKKRMVMLPGHGTLIITELYEEDVGQYQCFASNKFGTATSNSVFVRTTNDARPVEDKSRPSFINTPEPNTAAEQEFAAFYCKAQGTPEPTIKWVFNGKPIDEAPFNYRHIIRTNSITISDLVVSDTGNYGCNASNTFGYVYHDSYLNVLNEPPTIIEPPNTITVLEHDNVTFHCKAFGVPLPHIKWTKDEHILSGDRFTVTNIGSLEITNVTFADSGAYQCHSENKYGRATAKGTLNVKRGTKFIKRLEDTNIKLRNNINFNCQAEADAGLKLTYSWLKDGQRFYTGRTDTGALSKEEAGKLDLGEYTCVVSTPLDRIEDTATLFLAQVPNRPKIRNVMCSGKSATVTWKHEGDNISPITFYTIDYSTSFNQYTYISLSVKISPEKSTYTMDIRPWTKYSFRIKAHNKYGSSVPSYPSHMCQSQGNVPYKNPTNVLGFTEEKNTFRIQWDPVPIEEQNARNFHYRVSWKTDFRDEWMSTVVNDSSHSSLVIPNQHGDQRYRIKVTSVNQYGEANVKPLEVISYSEIDLNDYPKNLRVIKLTEEDEVLLGWTKVPQDNGNSRFRGYKIQIWPKNNVDNEREIISKGSTDRILITNLNSNTKYFARVMAFNQRYDGPVSDKISFTTLEEYPGPVKNVQIVPLGAFALWLTWQPALSPYYKVTGYVIYCHEIVGTNVEEKLGREPKLLGPNESSAKLAGLKPNTNYLIKIRAISGRGEGFDYITEENTLEYNPNPPDTPNFRFEKISRNPGNEAVKIQWLPSGKAGSNFYAQYRKMETLPWETTPIEVNEDFIIIEGLDFELAYEIRIVVIDGKYVTRSKRQFLSGKETLQNHRRIDNGRQDFEYSDNYGFSKYERQHPPFKTSYPMYTSYSPRNSNTCGLIYNLYLLYIIVHMYI